MRRTVILSEIEPAPLSFRQPAGVNLDLLLVFRDQANSIVDPTPIRPQLALMARSTGRIGAYDVETYDVGNGVGRVQVPGAAIVDPNGYGLELYQRSENVNPADPAIPTGIIASGVMVVSRGAYTRLGPLGMISVPVVVGPVGPRGETGAPGSDGGRGAIWMTGVGDPTATGNEITGDMYLDEATGNVWRFDGATWMMGTF